MTDIKIDDLEFKNVHLDYFKGQHKYEFRAFHNDVLAGLVSYDVFEGQYSVNYIYVPDALRRKGVGTELLYRLQELHPDVSFFFGYLTGDGSALLRTINKRVVENQKYKEFFEKRNIISKKLEEYDIMANRLQELIGENLSEPAMSERDNIIEKLKDWNELHDEIDALNLKIFNTPKRFEYLQRPSLVADNGMVFKI